MSSEAINKHAIFQHSADYIIKPLVYSLKFSCIIIFFIIVGCATSPRHKPSHRPIDKTDSDILSAQQASINQLIAQARTVESPLSEQYLIQAAELLLAQSRLLEAIGLLEKIRIISLPQLIKIRFSLLSIRIAIQQGDGRTAQAWLSSPSSGLFGPLSHTTQLQLHNLRAQTYALNHRYLASVRERVTLSPFLDGQSYQINHQTIWNTLLVVAQKDLEETVKRTINSEYKAWLQLAILNKKYQNNLDLQLQHLQHWQTIWPQHPAARQLPESLQLISSLMAERPQKIALLLPLDGELSSAGKAIRDGFMAAFYAARQNNSQIPEINIYDTSQNRDINAAYSNAVTNGAEFIIGPLQKYAVNDLISLPQLTIPTLALNHASYATEYPTNFFQFGLPKEDEIHQIVEHAWLQGFENAAVIVPNTVTGDRISKAFQEKWQALGGIVSSKETFQGRTSYTKTIERLLNVDLSKQRAKQLRRIIGEPLESNPRRRQDIDFVVLYADYKDAIQIRPALKYFGAGNIPVYATSNLFAGKSNQEQSEDLNNILYSDMPWMLYETDPLKKQIMEQWPVDQNQSRFFALGVDAYHLYPRIKQFQLLSNSHMYGATGFLRLNKQGIIERQLVWAQIRNGWVYPLPTVVSSKRQ